MNWIELFRTGTHTDSAGVTHTFTAADLAKIVNTFNPKQHEPPLVLGHPKDNAPAYGWVAQLKQDGHTLYGKFKDVPTKLKEAVEKGRYKKRSIALFANGALRHVGLLGAAAPAVQGLADIVAFAADGAGWHEFTAEIPANTNVESKMDPKEMAERLAKLQAENALLKAKADGADASKIAELEAQLKELQQKAKTAEEEKAKAEAAFAAATAAAQAKELEVKVDALVTTGQLLPKDKPAVMAFAQHLGAGAGVEMEFAAGSGKKSLQQHLFEFLSALPSNGLEHEFASQPATTSNASGVIPYSEIMNKV